MTELSQTAYTFGAIAIVAMIGLAITIYFLQKVKKQKNKIEDCLKTSKKEYDELFNNIQDGYALFEAIYNGKNEIEDFRYIKANESYSKHTSNEVAYLENRTLLEMFPTIANEKLKVYGEVAQNRQGKVEFERVEKKGNIYEEIVYNAGENRCISLYRDITKEKAHEAVIEKLNYEDALTRVMNRRAYERYIETIEVQQNEYAIIMVDANGLKLINDAFGHRIGDALLKKIASALQVKAKETDFIARIGGDEFVIILKRETCSKNVEARVKTIKKYLKNQNIEGLPVSVSIGSAINKEKEVDYKSIFRIAENEMYRDKLIHSGIYHEDIIHKVLEQVEKKGEKCGYGQLDDFTIKDIIDNGFLLLKSDKEKLFTAFKLAKSGKIGINAKVLCKLEPLTQEDWNEIKRHPETSYRIVSSVTKYAEHAELILAHHEQFNGKGYPKGLVGEEIPYLARVLSILEAYDAMASVRPYREALSKEEIIRVFSEDNGELYDPNLVAGFLKGI